MSSIQYIIVIAFVRKLAFIVDLFTRQPSVPILKCDPRHSSKNGAKIAKVQQATAKLFLKIQDDCSSGPIAKRLMRSDDLGGSV